MEAGVKFQMMSNTHCYFLSLVRRRCGQQGDETLCKSVKSTGGSFRITLVA